MKLKTVIVIALLCCFLACSHSGTTESPQTPSPTPSPTATPTPLKTDYSINEVQSEGYEVKVIGVNVEKLKVSVSAAHPGRVTIPVGTVFESESGDTQTMMAAHKVVLTFTGVVSEPYLTPQTQTTDVEVYCINRFLDAPIGTSEFTVGGGGEELDPVRRLAECLDHHTEAPHEARQMAIWVTSDNFINLTEAEVREKMRAHAEEMIKNPNSQAWTDQRSEGHLSEDEVREIINDPEQLEAVRTAAYKEVDEEISDYKSIAGPLLEKCGFNLATSKFFQTS